MPSKVAAGAVTTRCIRTPPSGAPHTVNMVEDVSYTFVASGGVVLGLIVVPVSIPEPLPEPDRALLKAAPAKNEAFDF